MDLNTRVDVTCRLKDENFQTVTMTETLYFFFILISVDTKFTLILHTKFQPHTPRENDDFISVAIFSNGNHLAFSTRLNFTVLKPWSLIMQHTKFKIRECIGLRE